MATRKFAQVNHLRPIRKSGDAPKHTIPPQVTIGESSVSVSGTIVRLAYPRAFIYQTPLIFAYEGDTISSHDMLESAQLASDLLHYRRKSTTARGDSKVYQIVRKHRTITERQLIETMVSYVTVNAKRSALQSFIASAEGEYRPHWTDWRTGRIFIVQGADMRRISYRAHSKALASGIVRMPVRGSYKSVRVYENRMRPYHNREDIVQDISLGIVEASTSGHHPSIGTLLYLAQRKFAAGTGWTGDPEEASGYDEKIAEYRPKGPNGEEPAYPAPKHSKGRNSAHTAPRNFHDAMVADSDRMVSNDPAASRKIADAEELNRRIAKLRASARDEADTTIIQLLYNGQSLSAIGRAIGMNHSSVINRINRMKESVLQAETAAA